MDPSCITLYPAASPTATLDTILVEKSFLLRLSAAYFDPDYSEIRKFIHLARFSDPHFHIVYRISADLWPDKSIQMHFCN